MRPTESTEADIGDDVPAGGGMLKKMNIRDWADYQVKEMVKAPTHWLSLALSFASLVASLCAEAIC